MNCKISFAPADSSGETAQIFIVRYPAFSSLKSNQNNDGHPSKPLITLLKNHEIHQISI
ncbi:MAG: hypothetical protein NTX45_17685 [Proteobacteria bacterium]|nr:hypothetical protein [Pseudomonadota bacterium]